MASLEVEIYFLSRRSFLEDERGGGGKFKGQPAWQLDGGGSEHWPRRRATSAAASGISRIKKFSIDSTKLLSTWGEKQGNRGIACIENIIGMSGWVVDLG